MKRSQKFVALGLALLMALSLFGCKNSQTSSTSEPASSKPVTITWYLVRGSVPQGQDAISQAASKYLQEKAKLNVNLKINWLTWANYATQVPTMIAAHESFDLIKTQQGDYFSYSRKGAFVELTDALLKKDAPDAQKVIGGALLKATQVDGKLYSLPVEKDTCHSYGVVLNKALVDKYGFDINTIKSLNDLTPMFATIKEKEPGYYAYWANPAVDILMADNIDLVGGGTYIPGAVYSTNDASNTKVFDQWEMPECKSFLRTIRSWYKAGYMCTDTAANTTTLLTQGKYFCRGVYGLIPGTAAQYSNSNVTWVQKALLPTVTSVGDIAGSVTAISNTSKNPDMALKVLNLTYKDPAFLNLLVYGIEGTNYTKVSDNVVKKVANSNYDVSGSAWEIGNQFLDYLMDNEATDKWTQLKKFNASATILNNAGFAFNNDAVSSEVAALTNVSGQYWDMLAYGKVDPDQYLPEFITKLKANGLDKVIAEEQKQYTAFLKSKKETK